MSFLNDLTLGQIVSRIAAFLIYSALQGGLLSFLARLFGDLKPTHDGRLTFNPFSHLALSGLFMAVLFRMGWIRPLRFNGKTVRGGRLGLVAIAVLGLAGMILAIPLLDLARPAIQAVFPQTAGYAALNLIQQFQEITLASTMLNILPLPGLIGAAFLQAIWPHAEPRIRRLEPLFIALLIIILVLGWMPDPIPVMLPLLSLV
jgi:hypothetical protein